MVDDFLDCVKGRVVMVVFGGVNDLLVLLLDLHLQSRLHAVEAVRSASFHNKKGVYPYISSGYTRALARTAPVAPATALSHGANSLEAICGYYITPEQDMGYCASYLSHTGRNLEHGTNSCDEENLSRRKIVLLCQARHKRAVS